MICCICGNEIALDETLSLALTVKNALQTSQSAPRQNLHAHDYCFSQVLHDSVPFDAEVLAE
jgi:hypothetical protein